MTTAIISVSKTQYPEDTFLGKSWWDCFYEGNANLFHVHNTDSRSLPVIYNNFIEDLIKEKFVQYAVFCHDDLTLDCPDIQTKLDQAIGIYSDYAICGLAGSKECVIKEQNLWHIMSNKSKHERHTVYSGAVGHYVDDQIIMTNFGPMPERVILLDGVFIAVNLEKINRVGLRFDENIPSKFHFYDLDFSLQANNSGLKMTTWPIWAVHQSHGLSDLNNEEWKKGNKYFIRKWKK